jgi:hypothetical protein
MDKNGYASYIDKFSNTSKYTLSNPKQVVDNVYNVHEKDSCM